MLAALRENFAHLVVGVVTPVTPSQPGAPAHRGVSASLAKYAHWTRKYILDEELAKAQLPNQVPTKKKPIRKPEHW